MIASLRRHWPEYLIEAWGLGTFMVFAAAFATLLFAPASPLAAELGSRPLLGRGLMGLAMGLTAVGLIYSPWGKRSGAHFNPAVTLSFYSLGKVEPWDAVFYPFAQALGGTLGVWLSVSLFGPAFGDAPVAYVTTVPGPAGPWVALLAETLISALLFGAVLVVSSSRFANWTGLVAGGLVAIYILLEAPLSGMSMNPARTFASALPSGIWTAFWVYLAGPLAGMLGAATLFRLSQGTKRVFCAKLHHRGCTRCIFRCTWAERDNAAGA